MKRRGRASARELARVDGVVGPVHIVEYDTENPRCGAKATGKNITVNFKTTTCRHCHGYCGCIGAGWGCFRRMLVRRMAAIKWRLLNETVDKNRTHRIINTALIKVWGREYKGVR